MQDAFHHQRFTRSLEHFSSRLDELLSELRRVETSLMPAELLDEIASTLGELMLVLIEHKSVRGVEVVVSRAAIDTRLLREALRRGQLQSNQITEAIGTLLQELGSVIHEDKQAA